MLEKDNSLNFKTVVVVGPWMHGNDREITIDKFQEKDNLQFGW